VGGQRLKDETVLGPPGPTEVEPFRLIDWGTDGFVTIETSVGHLPRQKRAALLAGLNAFAAVLNLDEVKAESDELAARATA